MDEKTITAGKNCFSFQIKSDPVQASTCRREFQITSVHLLVLLNYLGVLELFHKEGGTDSHCSPSLIWFLLIHAEAGGVLPKRAALCSSGSLCRLPCCSVLHSLGPHSSPASMSYGFRNPILPDWLPARSHFLQAQLWRLDGITMAHPPSRPEGFSSGIVIFLLSP